RHHRAGHDHGPADSEQLAIRMGAVGERLVALSDHVLAHRQRRRTGRAESVPEVNYTSYFGCHFRKTPWSVRSNCRGVMVTYRSRNAATSVSSSVSPSVKTLLFQK